jgi:nitrogen regulatory protein P-II 1
MKEIKAFVRQKKVYKIVRKLKESGYENITISEAEGTGKFQTEEAFVSLNYSFTDSKIAKLELVVPKKEVDAIVGVISEYGKTNNPGDGIIYVADVEKAFRVKTGLKNGF